MKAGERVMGKLASTILAAFATLVLATSVVQATTSSDKDIVIVKCGEVNAFLKQSTPGGLHCIGPGATCETGSFGAPPQVIMSQSTLGYLPEACDAQSDNSCAPCLKALANLGCESLPGSPISVGSNMEIGTPSGGGGTGFTVVNTSIEQYTFQCGGNTYSSWGFYQ